MLSGLVGLTSLAVGATTSPWLVPPYLAAMAWLLMGSSPRRTVEGSAIAGAAIPQEVAEPELLPAGEIASADRAVPGDLAKPKTGRGRGRKPKAKPRLDFTAEKAAATWVQVAPGKFVRVEKPVATNDDSIAEPEPQMTPPVESLESAIVADVSVAAEPTTEAELETGSIEPSETWPEIALITESEPPSDPVYVDPPEPARLVAVDQSSRSSQPRVWPTRSARVRPDPRPKLRRGNGRVGPVPRVVLHRG